MRVSRRDVVEGRTACVYCGVVATSVDHIPPILLRNAVAENERYCVPACLECNSALGAKRLFALLDRQIYMRLWIRRKYAAYLRVQNRTPDEALDLGYNLKTMMDGVLRTKTWVESRLSYDFNANTAWLKYFASPRESKAYESTDHISSSLDSEGQGEAARCPGDPFPLTFSEELDELIESDPWINGPEAYQTRYSVA